MLVLERGFEKNDQKYLMLFQPIAPYKYVEIGIRFET